MAGGDTSNAAPAGTRILKELSFYRGALPNPYDRPIEGVVVTLDMNKLKVVDFVDSGIRPVDTTTSGSSTTQRTRCISVLTGCMVLSSLGAMECAAQRG